MDARNVKTLKSSYQERRRAAALEKQKTARKQATDRARKLALGAADSEESAHDSQQDVELAEASSSGVSPSPEAQMQSANGGRRASTGSAAARRQQYGAKLRQYYAGQLMQPEWLVDVPPDLGTDWYALPRPEGQRCLVIAARGSTVARGRSGALLERFSSPLPAGGPGQPSSDDSFCILDCVYHAPDQTYYVLDLMCWKGYSLYGCSAEFRLFWVQSKLAESGATTHHPTVVYTGASGSGAHHRQQQPQQGQQQGQAQPPAAGETEMQTEQQQHLQQPAFGQQQQSPAPATEQQQQPEQQLRRFLPLPAYRCTPGGLQMSHSHPVSFCRDGLLLLHKEAQYSPGQTPLALLWKDAASSRYFIDTDAAGVPLAQQQAVLEFRMDRTVATHDEAPVVLGRMPESFVQQLGSRLRPGKLLKFSIGPGGIAFQDGQPVGADLLFAGPANQRRGRADSISKIIFQHLARTRPITLEQLLAAASASYEAAAAAAAAAAAGGGSFADKMGSGDSSGLLGVGSMSLQSEAAGGSMALDAAETDGIEVDS